MPNPDLFYVYLKIMANIWKIVHQPLLLRRKRMLKLPSPPSCFTSNSSGIERNSLLDSNSVPGGLSHTRQGGEEILLALCFLCMLANHPVVWTGDLIFLLLGLFPVDTQMPAFLLDGGIHISLFAENHAFLGDFSVPQRVTCIVFKASKVHIHSDGVVSHQFNNGLWLPPAHTIYS